MTDAKHDVDPRTEADAHISRALQIVVDASGSDDHVNPCVRRDYTPDELEDLFFALGTAMIKLRKLPGGKEARDRFYARVALTVRERRPDAELNAEAIQIVKRAFGDNVDLNEGTMGRKLVEVVTLELKDVEALQGKFLALAATIRQP